MGGFPLTLRVIFRSNQLPSKPGHAAGSTARLTSAPAEGGGICGQKMVTESMVNHGESWGIRIMSLDIWLVVKKPTILVNINGYYMVNDGE